MHMGSYTFIWSGLIINPYWICANFSASYRMRCSIILSNTTGHFILTIQNQTVVRLERSHTQYYTANIHNFKIKCYFLHRTDSQLQDKQYNKHLHINKHLGVILLGLRRVLAVYMVHLLICQNS